MRWSVEREVNARSATTLMGKRRRLRASWMSAPNFRKARRTAIDGVWGVGIIVRFSRH